MNRRNFIQLGAALPAAAVLSALPAVTPVARAQQLPFAPRPGAWRNFEVTTEVEILKTEGATRVWLPVPAIDADYQKSMDSTWTAAGGTARLVREPRYGASILAVEFPAEVARPQIRLVSRFQTRDRAVDWSTPSSATLDRAAVRLWTEPTELIPTDGIVRRTAQEITRRRRSDRDKAQALYDWVVTNTFREPKTRGCGIGDIKTMLETGNLYGKCADLNALFVGLARASGIPARDVYGVRLAPSAFGYKALSANSANITRAQHCRAEIFLAGHGWVAMDPADVTKVMREETAEWIRAVDHPLVAPVKAQLFGAWEGNWLAFNLAHDLVLPGSSGRPVPFFMYPHAETGRSAVDSLDPDNFRYVMSAREITA